jgi:hypothetical protein
MQLETAGKRHTFRFGWQWLASCCWALVFLGLLIRLMVASGLHSVYPIFSDAARCWLQGQDMYWPEHYVPSLDSFRYSPAIAAFFAAFAWLPDRAGSMAWLSISTLALAIALHWWLRDGLPVPIGPWKLTGASLLVLTFAAGNLNNGQTNAVITAMLLLAALACACKRWNLAAACLVIASLLKVYPLAFGLLLALIYPRQLVPRLIIGLAIGLAIPFFLKSPAYVVRQYQEWFALMRSDDRKFAALTVCYRDLWLLIRVFGLPISSKLYIVIQAAGALGAAGICYWGKLAGLPSRALIMLSLSLATLWMTLLGPATESSTYLLIAPALVWVVFSSPEQRSRLDWIFLGLCLAFFFGAHICVWFPETVRRGSILFQPIATLVLAGVVSRRAFIEINARRQRMSSLHTGPHCLAA